MRARIARMALLAAAMTVIGSPAAAFGADVTEGTDGLETDGEVVRIETPAPGHDVAWELRVRATTDDLSGLRLVLVDAAGDALDGPDPLQFALSDAEGRPLASGTAAELRDTSMTLAAPPAGEWAVVRARAELPASAGDAYRGSAATLRFRFLAVHDEALQKTGSALSVWPAAALAAALGVLLLVRRRRVPTGGTSPVRDIAGGPTADGAESADGACS